MKLVSAHLITVRGNQIKLSVFYSCTSSGGLGLLPLISFFLLPTVQDVDAIDQVVVALCSRGMSQEVGHNFPACNMCLTHDVLLL